MKPRIFLSSTIRDLGYIRDALRECIEILGYEPVMSEHSEIGFLPNLSAEDSCYASLEQCDLLIVVIGRRYGSVGKDSKSITQNEVRRARELNVPVYCFIDRDAETELRILEKNPDAKLDNFDNPAALVDFVREVVTSDRNNSIIAFSSLDDAKERLKKQLALLFGSLLRQRNDVIQRSLAELLVEVREIRYGLPPEKAEDSAALFAALKFFLDELDDSHGLDERYHYRRLIKAAKGSISAAILPLVRSPTFKAFLERSNVRVEVMTFDERKARRHPGPQTGLVLAASNGPLLGQGGPADLHYILYPNLEFWVDQRVLRDLERIHFDFKKMFTEVVRDAITATQSPLK